MRLIHVAVAGFLTALLLPAPVFAAANVLLPQSDSDTSSMPDLGLGVTKAAPMPGSVAAPTQTPVPPVETQPTPPPSPTSKPPTTSTNNMPPQVKQAMPSTPALPVVSPIDKASAAKLPRGQIPTQVIQMPDNSNALSMLGKGMPYNLAIAIDNKSSFGAQDIQKITSTLGLSRNQIPQSCILTLRGLLRTDKGGYIIDGPMSPQALTYYDGVIESFMMNTTALCYATTLPPGAGLIVQVGGGRYKVDLGAVNCPAPTRQVTQLFITYDGSPHAVCTYN